MTNRTELTAERIERAIAIQKELIRDMRSDEVDKDNRETAEEVAEIVETVVIPALRAEQERIENPGATSDGYHTFDELYHHRAVLFSVICNENPDKAWKSKQHDDPEQPMYDGMFICGIDTPEGQATYHYDIDPYWDMFRVKELKRAPYWDGHTPQEAIRRIGLLGRLLPDGSAE